MENENIPIETIKKHAKVINDLNFNQQTLVKKIDALEAEQKKLQETTSTLQKEADIKKAVDETIKKIEDKKEVVEKKDTIVAKDTEAVKSTTEVKGGDTDGKTE